MDAEPDCYLAIDESGNSGPNLLDTGQPVLVHAALLAPRDALERLREHARNLKRAFLPAAKELHSGILNTAAGRRAAASLLHVVTETCGAVPLIFVAEKNYALAAHVVETCMDGAYNDRVPVGLTGAAVEKQRFAAALAASISGETLRTFGTALIAREPVKLHAAIEQIGSELRAADLRPFAHQVEGALVTITEQCDALSRSDGTARGFNTLNVPTFSALLGMAELAAAGAGYSNGLVVHDVSPQGDAYQYVFDIQSKGTHGRIQLNNGGMVVVGFDALQRFEQRDSEQEELIQLADVIAGTIARVANGRRDDPVLDPWRLFLFAAMPHLTAVAGSPELARLLFQAAIRRTG